MPRNKKKLILSGILFLFGAWFANACSVAFYTSGPTEGTEIHLTGRTADLTKVLAVNHKINIFPRGLVRSGNTDSPDVTVENPITWTSKYGSIVLDDFADGFNEKGLCVHPLYLDKTAYPEQDGVTPGISNQKLTSYLLDNAATVDECLELLDQVTVVMDKFGSGIYRGDFPIHWAIRDSSNNVAFIEFINKGTEQRPRSEKVVYQGAEYDVLTNEPYLNKQLRYYRRFENGRRGVPGDFNAMARFVRLKMFKKTLEKEDTAWKNVVNIFSLMSCVHCIPGVVDYGHKEPKDEKQWPTVWTLVADVDNLVYYIKMTSCPNTIWVDMKKLDFSTLSKTGTLATENTNLLGEVNGNFTWE